MGLRDPRLSWFLTYPQCPLEPCAVLDALKEKKEKPVQWLVAREKHSDGNYHIHAYVKYELGSGVKLKDAPTYFDIDKYHGNYQPCRNPKNVVAYCTKESDYIASFDIKHYTRKQAKLAIETIKSKTAKQALEDGDIHINSIKNYMLARSILTDPYEHTGVRGLWIWGPPGVGKSHHARLFAGLYGDVYTKLQNKWWDGYAGEPAVLLDDLDTPLLGHHLKIWLDKWSCTGEVKGAIAQLQHRVFIITSNYQPRDLWSTGDKPDDTLTEAIERRCTIVHVESRSETIPELEELASSVPSPSNPPP